MLRQCLSCLDCCLLEVSTASQGRALVKFFTRTLVLTDICLPDIHGIDFVRQICAETESVVVVISALSSLNFVIAALDAGADFIPNPFSIGELGARVRVALRHAAMKRETPRPIFRAGGLEVDFRHRRVRVSGKNVHLTPLEYRILSLLIENADRVLTYERLLQAWTSQKRRGVEHIRVLVEQLRQKLESDPQKPRLLVNAPRIGYQFQLRGR
jgi:two-component system, OmpR family, KDP operon response regulator KdpE